jgi:hypothetical protein
MGYPRETLGYYFYNREEGKVFVAQNSVFVEKEFLSQKESGSRVRLEEIRDEPTGSESTGLIVEPKPVVAPEPRRLARLRSVRDVLLLDSDEPTNYQKAVMGKDSESWLGAMRSKLKSMDGNEVWNLVDLPTDVRAVECKWIFKRKMTWMEMFLSIKLGLSRRGSDRFKELTTTRLSRR